MDKDRGSAGGYGGRSGIGKRTSGTTSLNQASAFRGSLHWDAMGPESEELRKLRASTVEVRHQLLISSKLYL